MRCALIFSALLCTSVAHAGLEDTFALGPRPMALAGSYAARPGDVASSYYNPAGLSSGGQKGFFEATFALVYGHPTLHASAPDGHELPTPSIRDTGGIVGGARFDVGHPFKIDGLIMGFSMYVPSSVFEWKIRPDDDLQWALLTDRTQAISIHTGLAYRMTPWLSLGVGLRVLFGVQTITQGYVTDVGLQKDPTTGAYVVHTATQLGTDGQVFGRATPLFGALVTPIPRLRIGVSYKHASYVDDWGSTRISGVPDLGDMGYAHRFAHYFEPSQLTAAVSFDITSNVDVSADFTWAHWADALSTNRNFFGDGYWGDTIIPAFGVRWHPVRSIGLMGGYRFQKSPVDNFGGPNNLLDGDRHTIGTGFELDLERIFGPSLANARFTFGLQNIIVEERSETKDFRRFASDDAWMKNPGYPSYTFGGHLMGGSVGVEARW